MKINCSIQFAAYIYQSFLFMERRLEQEARAFDDIGDMHTAKELYKTRDQICKISQQMADEIREARFLGRSVSVELRLQPSSREIQNLPQSHS